jgi:hypothetical protein
MVLFGDFSVKEEEMVPFGEFSVEEEEFLFELVIDVY